VHLAQALAWRADLLILDEPTAGLDVAGIELLDAAIRAECERGTAVVVCTHDIRDALEADRALLLAGRVVAYGPPAETLTRDALLETFGLVVAQLPGGSSLTMDPSHRHDHDHGHGAAPALIDAGGGAFRLGGVRGHDAGSMRPQRAVAKLVDLIETGGQVSGRGEIATAHLGVGVQQIVDEARADWGSRCAVGSSR